MRSLLATGLLCGWIVPAHALGFDEALAAALRDTPQIQAEQQAIASLSHELTRAGEQPDPQLFFGVENLPIGGDERFSLTRESMTMQKLGLMQEWQPTDLRRAKVAQAQARLRQGEAALAATRLEIQLAVAQAWLDRYFAEARGRLLAGFRAENRLNRQSMAPALAGQQRSASEALAPQLASVELDNLQDEIDTQIRTAKQQLARYLGPRSEEALSGEPPPRQSTDATAPHPALQRQAGLLAEAEANRAAADAATQPDWAVEIAYQHRGPGFGDMVSIQWQRSLPLFGARRQQPQRLAQQAEQQRQTLEQASEQARLHTEQQQLEQEQASLARQWQRLTTISRPLLLQNETLLLKAYANGQDSLQSVLAARRERLMLDMKCLELEARRAALIARLNLEFGGTAP